MYICCCCILLLFVLPLMVNKVVYIRTKKHRNYEDFSDVIMSGPVLKQHSTAQSCSLDSVVNQLHCEAKKLHPSIFCNNFVKPRCILIICGTQILNCSGIAHLSCWVFLSHLVKYNMRFC